MTAAGGSFAANDADASRPSVTASTRAAEGDHTQRKNTNLNECESTMGRRAEFADSLPGTAQVVYPSACVGRIERCRINQRARCVAYLEMQMGIARRRRIAAAPNGSNLLALRDIERLADARLRGVEVEVL